MVLVGATLMLVGAIYAYMGFSALNNVVPGYGAPQSGALQPALS